VANALLFDIVANVAAIPAAPDDQDAVEVTNGTGIESFTPLSGVPSGFVGDSGLSVRLIYDDTNSTWVWLQYFPNDPENRYGDAIVTLQGDVSDLQTDLGIAQTDILGLDSAKLDVSTAASTYLTQTNAGTTYQPLSGMSSYLTTSDASSTYLTQSNAASTYQTQAGMSSYVATSVIGTTVQYHQLITEPQHAFDGCPPGIPHSLHVERGGVCADGRLPFHGTLHSGPESLSGSVEIGFCVQHIIGIKPDFVGMLDVLVEVQLASEKLRFDDEPRTGVGTVRKESKPP
jgi:hypothetical protein